MKKFIIYYLCVLIITSLTGCYYHEPFVPEPIFNDDGTPYVNTKPWEKTDYQRYLESITEGTDRELAEIEQKRQLNSIDNRLLMQNQLIIRKMYAK
jgi:hypothetical protein